MLNISFLASTKVELQEMIVCIVVNGEKIQSPTMTLTLIRQCPSSNLSEIFSCTIMSSNFMFLDRVLFELSCTNVLNKFQHTHTHRDIQGFRGGALGGCFFIREESFNHYFHSRSTNLNSMLWWPLPVTR